MRLPGSETALKHCKCWPQSREDVQTSLRMRHGPGRTGVEADLLSCSFPGSSRDDQEQGVSSPLGLQTSGTFDAPAGASLTWDPLRLRNGATTPVEVKGRAPLCWPNDSRDLGQVLVKLYSMQEEGITTGD